MGFVPLKEGSIQVGETLLDISTIDSVRRQIAWIPQELALPFEWVKEMVALPFGLKVNRSVPFSEERLFTCFDELGLEEELYDKRVNEISGGQRQRIMIAVATLMQKPLLIVDEPTSALDSDSTDKSTCFLPETNEGGKCHPRRLSRPGICARMQPNDNAITKRLIKWELSTYHIPV